MEVHYYYDLAWNHIFDERNRKNFPIKTIFLLEKFHFLLFLFHKNYTDTMKMFQLLGRYIFHFLILELMGLEFHTKNKKIYEIHSWKLKTKVIYTLQVKPLYINYREEEKLCISLQKFISNRFLKSFILWISHDEILYFWFYLKTERLDILI